MRKYLSILFVTLFCACQDQVTLKQNNFKTSQSENFVATDDAFKLASAQAPLLNSKDGKSGRKKIKSTFEVHPDRSGTSMYIINYDGGGFIIVAADNRIDPILAYSDTNSFPTDQQMLPQGILGWMSAVHNTINKIRAANPEQGVVLKNQWKRYSENPSVLTGDGRLASTITIGDCNMGDSSFEERTTVNPLTASTWNQNANYNTECPALGCSANGGRAWVGCVPVATGQIMRFYQYPTSLNWAEMPLTNSTPTTAALLRDIGNRLQTTYGCDASSTTNANIKGTLASYGYPMPSDGNYNFWTVASEIQNGRPVILGGYHDTQWWIFGTQNGHTWVADGLILSRYYSCSPDPNTPGEWVAVDQGYSALLYMNWGWGGTANAWYSANNFNPSGYTYNVQPFQVVNIRKP